jgi:hypothetical protein
MRHWHPIYILRNFDELQCKLGNLVTSTLQRLNLYHNLFCNFSPKLPDFFKSFVIFHLKDM